MLEKERIGKTISAFWEKHKDELGISRKSLYNHIVLHSLELETANIVKVENKIGQKHYTVLDEQRLLEFILNLKQGKRKQGK